MVPGWPGKVLIDTTSVLAVLGPQLLLAVTEIVPPVFPDVIVIAFDVEVPVQPEGKVHEYDVAPEIGITLYELDGPWQMLLEPEITPGC